MIRHKICLSDLAAMAGVARENVSRVMSNWIWNKVVARSSRFYYLLDSRIRKTSGNERLYAVQRGHNRIKGLVIPAGLNLTVRGESTVCTPLNRPSQR